MRGFQLAAVAAQLLAVAGQLLVFRAQCGRFIGPLAQPVVFLAQRARAARLALQLCQLLAQRAGLGGTLLCRRQFLVQPVIGRGQLGHRRAILLQRLIGLRQLLLQILQRGGVAGRFAPGGLQILFQRRNPGLRLHQVVVLGRHPGDQRLVLVPQGRRGGRLMPELVQLVTQRARLRRGALLRRQIQSQPDLARGQFRDFVLQFLEVARAAGAGGLRRFQLLLQIGHAGLRLIEVVLAAGHEAGQLLALVGQLFIPGPQGSCLGDQRLMLLPQRRRTRRLVPELVQLVAQRPGVRHRLLGGRKLLLQVTDLRFGLGELLLPVLCCHRHFRHGGGTLFERLLRPGQLFIQFIQPRGATRALLPGSLQIALQGRHPRLGLDEAFMPGCDLLGQCAVFLFKFPGALLLRRPCGPLFLEPALGLGKFLPQVRRLAARGLGGHRGLPQVFLLGLGQFLEPGLVGLHGFQLLLQLHHVLFGLSQPGRQGRVGLGRGLLLQLGHPRGETVVLLLPPAGFLRGLRRLAGQLGQLIIGGIGRLAGGAQLRHLLVQPRDLAPGVPQLSLQGFRVADRGIALGLQTGVVAVDPLVLRAHLGTGGIVARHRRRGLARLVAETVDLLVEGKQLERRALHLVVQPRIVALQVRNDGIPVRARPGIIAGIGRGRRRGLGGGGPCLLFLLQPVIPLCQLLVDLLQLAQRAGRLLQPGRQRGDLALILGMVRRRRNGGHALLLPGQFQPQVLDLGGQHRGLAPGCFPVGRGGEQLPRQALALVPQLLHLLSAFAALG